MELIEGIGIKELAFTDEYCEGLLDLYWRHSNGHYEGSTTAGFDKTSKSTVELALYSNKYPERTISEFDINNFINVLNDTMTEYASQHSKKYNVPHDKWNPYALFDNVPTEYTYVKIQRYEKNIGHYNSYHQDREGQLSTINRWMVFLLYLNSVEVGGETSFPFQKTNIRPKQGTIVLWPAGFPYVHRGNIPRSGDKFIVTCWLEWNYKSIDLNEVYG